MSTKLPSRVFKTAWFTRAARKARIGDGELCLAIQQVMAGQADDLGGGVFKKRLNDNAHRSIIVAKGGRYCLGLFDTCPCDTTVPCIAQA